MKKAKTFPSLFRKLKRTGKRYLFLLLSGAAAPRLQGQFGGERAAVKFCIPTGREKIAHIFAQVHINRLFLHKKLGVNDDVIFVTEL
jgi:hypothetical protein